MPGKYGFIEGVEREHSLDEMELEVHLGSTFESMRACNRELWKRGDALSSITSLGLISGCAFVSGPAVGEITKCEVWSTEANLEHELMHCKGYADHPLWL